MNTINVTKTFLPPLKEYEQYLKKIWQNTWLTNQGPLLQEFELRTKKTLGISDFHFVANGTVALQVALEALDITGCEVITTPFSYVATTSSILWEKNKPVFVDIEPNTYCIDAEKIERAITHRTKAILAVHIFGHPCEVEKIESLAKKHKLKVIYDGSHAFGVEHKGKSLMGYGDISTGSFHATKLFHTIEGGCIISKDKKISERVELMKRFGHNADDHYILGINAKASEFQAAMGLCNLKYIDSIIQGRGKISALYDNLLDSIVQKPLMSMMTKYNYSYYPVLLKSQEQLLKTIKALNTENIFPRRYFFPSLNTLPYIEDRQRCPISEDIASRIMCLPLYPDLEEKYVKQICKIIKDNNAT